MTSRFFVYNGLLELLARSSFVRTYGNAWGKGSSFQHKYSFGKTKYESPSSSYLLDETVARDIAKHVKEHTNSDAYVFEANPGPGTLSRALLESGIPRLRAFEKEESFLHSLQELTSMYPSCFEIVPEDIMLLPQLEVKKDDGRTQEIDAFYRGIQKRSWQEASPISIVAIIANQKSVNFMRSMLAKLSMMSSFFAFGRCQFFLILSRREYMYMTAKPRKYLDKYRSCTVLYNIFFDINIVREIPGICLSSDHLSSARRLKWDASNLHFAHLTPRADLFETVAPADMLPELYYFVRHHMSKRTNYVIQEMEQWVPSCGARLIYGGMKMFSRFGDLSPLEMLQVFHLFSSWPDYGGSAFRHIAQSFFREHCYDLMQAEE